MAITINCDMGEGFGLYRCGDDEGLMPFIHIANVACGFHAGDPAVMQRTVRTAKAHGVAVGAHPSFPDLQGFGRREMKMRPDELTACIVYQVGALKAFLDREEMPFHDPAADAAPTSPNCQSKRAASGPEPIAPAARSRTPADSRFWAIRAV